MSEPLVEPYQCPVCTGAMGSHTKDCKSMTTPINDGGPAFPISFQSSVTEQEFAPEYYYGMSLRDYFAAKALPIFMQERVAKPTAEETMEVIASACYMIADAMIKAREEKK